ncbi:hypothetical protein PoB_006658700 [Plakobranchus ocellatus]|uniref:Transmembrane protein n=1 Tax=Plakobranchus ocellatus TaxID=259542 RepID=A0AAV4D774_9GAST|nr:hypothetical protein PoB_006658700 [Plakobranchus ocellatus]
MVVGMVVVIESGNDYGDDGGSGDIRVMVVLMVVVKIMIMVIIVVVMVAIYDGGWVGLTGNANGSYIYGSGDVGGDGCRSLVAVVMIMVIVW